MPIQFQCQSCRSTLRVPDDLAGRKVRCPKCRNVADVRPSSSVSFPPVSDLKPIEESDLKPIEEDLPSKSSPEPPEEPVEIRVRARKSAPVHAQEVDEEDWDAVDDPPARSARSKSRKGEAISARPLSPPPPIEVEDEEEEKNVVRPRRFKRRRRKQPKSSLPGGWGFVRWIAAAVVYIIIGSAIAIHMVVTGHAGELIVDAIEWGLLMPLTLILFFLSMFIGSAIAGGIDFGDIRTAIPKAIFLLAPINLFYVLLNWYIAFFLSLPFWIFGLILLFGLDVWESWFMIVINQVLNFGANIFLILIVVAMMHRAATMEDDLAPPDDFGNDQIEAPIQKPPPDLQKRFRR